MSEIHVGPEPRRSYARQWVSSILLIVYGGFVLLVTMWPNPQQLEFGPIASKVLKVLHSFGVPNWFGYDKLEFTMNIAMFAPLGFLLGIALARRAWWVGIFLLPAFSGAIELVQGVALDERVSTLYDVAANTIGGYIGLLLAMILRAMIYARDNTKIERELWERRYAAAELQRRQRAREAVATQTYLTAMQRPASTGAEPDPVTRILEPDFWSTGEAPTVRIPV